MKARLIFLCGVILTLTGVTFYLLFQTVFSDIPVVSKIGNVVFFQAVLVCIILIVGGATLKKYIVALSNRDEEDEDDDFDPMFDAVIIRQDFGKIIDVWLLKKVAILTDDSNGMVSIANEEGFPILMTKTHNLTIYTSTCSDSDNPEIFKDYVEYHEVIDIVPYEEHRKDMRGITPVGIGNV